MDASGISRKKALRPKPLAELLLDLRGIISKDAMVSLSAKKQSRASMLPKRTTEKVFKPMSPAEMRAELQDIISKDSKVILSAKKQSQARMLQMGTTEKAFKPMRLAEMRAELEVLRPQSSKRMPQTSPSAKKKSWNSLGKIEKKISHRADGQLKNAAVRNGLNYQSKPKAGPNPRRTLISSDTPNIQKPGANKSLYLQAQNSMRISGTIPQTPVETEKPIKNKMTIANKENNPKIAVIPPTPKLRRIATPTVNTPLSNLSWESGSDASFLQNEKEILEFEERVKAIVEEQTLENIAEVSPPVFTPFKEYRKSQDNFYNSSFVEKTALYNDNPIMCFDKPSNKEESVKISSCKMINKATSANEKTPTLRANQLEEEKQTENNIKILENTIQMLTKLKLSLEESLKNQRNLIDEKQNGRKVSEYDKNKTEKNNLHTPLKVIDGKALNVYMKMKNQMNFLSTPMVNREMGVPDTPAVTSHNIQKQLNKLFDS